MTDFQRIYLERAADYHRLIAAEDVKGRVGQWLEAVLRGTRGEVLDVGAGTGRVSGVIARALPEVRLVCTDASAAMLTELGERWKDEFGERPAPDAVVADYRTLPFETGRFAAVTAGWAVGHLTGFHPATWREEARRVLRELVRVAEPGAPIAILETLGTGTPEPAPPNEALAALYRMFEADGFTRTVLRTDYLFATRVEAEALVSFFFGPEMVSPLEDAEDGVALIEWTGAWQRRA
jgi:ubiquinone/menaquinone biosynthesis C-methylase UbiE